MSGRPAKALLLEALSRLPDDASLESVLERTLVLTAIETGRLDVALGRTVPQAEVMRALGRPC